MTPASNPNPPSTRARRRQRGIALVIVLGMAALFAYVATMCIVASSTSRVTSKVDVLRQQGRFACESAHAYVQWMIISDRAARPRNRSLGQPLISNKDEIEFNIWAADGKPYTLPLGEGGTIQFRILDANRGWNLAGRLPGSQLRRELGISAPEKSEDARQVDYFLDSLDDYVDSDDFVRLYGMEADDYAAIGLEDFPRNGELLFAEEAYWIRNIEYLAPVLSSTQLGISMPEDLIRVIPPAGFKFSTKPSFFSSSPEMIQSTVRLDLQDLERALEARQRWYENGISIREGLGNLYPRIANQMSFEESGIYTLEVTATFGNGDVTRRVLTTMDLSRLPRGTLRPTFQVWRQLIY